MAVTFQPLNRPPQHYLSVAYALARILMWGCAEDQFKFRCKQVNLVQRTNVEGEEEFLVSEHIFPLSTSQRTLVAYLMEERGGSLRPSRRSRC